MLFQNEMNKMPKIMMKFSSNCLDNRIFKEFQELKGESTEGWSTVNY